MGSSVSSPEHFCIAVSDEGLQRWWRDTSRCAHFNAWLLIAVRDSLQHIVVTSMPRFTARVMLAPEDGLQEAVQDTHREVYSRLNQVFTQVLRMLDDDVNSQDRSGSVNQLRLLLQRDHMSPKNHPMMKAFNVIDEFIVHRMIERDMSWPDVAELQSWDDKWRGIHLSSSAEVAEPVTPLQSLQTFLYLREYAEKMRSVAVVPGMEQFHRWSELLKLVVSPTVLRARFLGRTTPQQASEFAITAVTDPCAVCCNQLTGARQLQCNHVFCEQVRAHASKCGLALTKYECNFSSLSILSLHLLDPCCFSV
jgi:hypothetical protein